MWQNIRRFRDNIAGNAALITALFSFAAIGFVAIDVDIGKVYVDRRKAQSVADLAAIVAAANIANATSNASTTLQKNQYPASALTSVQTGIYTANSALAPADRFVLAPPSSANAVRVTLQTQSPLIFGKLLYPSGAFTIVTKATAATTAVASFSIGSGLVSLNGGVLNSVLGGLLGTNLSLSVMDYQSLLGAQIDAFSFLGALATQANLTGVTYNQLLQSNVKLTDVLQALLTTQAAANGNTAATSALAAVVSAVNGSTTTITPQSLISLGPYSGLPVGQPPQFGLAMGVLNVLSATAQLANGTNQVAATMNLGLPGIADVSLSIAIGQLPQGTSWVAVGTQGATVNTAQTRVQLNIQLLGVGSLASVNLPLYVQVAMGTATLTSVACSYPNGSQSSATLAVTPGIVSASIGQVSSANLNNWTTDPTPAAAPLASIGPLQITGHAFARMGNTQPTPVTFSYAQIQADTMQTVTTTNYLSSLTSSLLGNLSLSIGGIPTPAIGSPVTSLIAGETSAIDQVLANVFATLGISLGQADVWVNGIRCDGAVLVN
jgi:uncharacterized membrane protein